MAFPRNRLMFFALLLAAGALAGMIAAVAPPARASTPAAAVEAPLRPPQVTVLKRGRDLAPGLIFLGPKKESISSSPGGGGRHGPLIVDDRGRPVWYKPLEEGPGAYDVRVQRYKGRPVLTWWQRASTSGPGYERVVGIIADRSYHVIARVRAGNGYNGDPHEFVLTPRGTALITIYHPTPRDLSSVGGASEGGVFDGIVQEIDVATGRVLFEWHSLDHVALGESYQPPPSTASEPYDYFHINSVNPDTDGHLLVSARHTWAVYKIHRRTGEVIWRLGGQKSDFALGRGVRFAWQHHALHEGSNRLRIFDNQSNGKPVRPRSRIVTIGLDTRRRTATLLSSVEHPAGLSTASQANAQRLPGGGLFVGWGALDRFSEFDQRGSLVFDARLPRGYHSYRAYRSPWTGDPRRRPTVTAERYRAGYTTVHAIWNGATEVARWRILAGRGPRALRAVGSAAWNGLDTSARIRTDARYVAVAAEDTSGRIIGRSRPTRVPGS